MGESGTVNSQGEAARLSRHGRDSGKERRKLRRWLYPTLLMACLVAFLTAILTLDLFPSQVQLNEGEVARQNIRAPKRVTYISQIKTKEARDKAAAAVPDVYDYDPGLAQNQKLKAINLCQYIADVRNELVSTPAQKRDRLARLTEPSLSEKAIEEILSLPDVALQAVCAETARVVEDVLRDRLRANQLDEAKAKIATRFSPTLPTAYHALTAELVNAFLKPNETYNAAETLRRRQEAQAAAEPVRFTVEKGEVVVREGNVVTALDLERLEALGLRKAAVDWPDALARAALVAVLVAILGLYLAHFHPNLWWGERRTLLLAGLLLLAITAAKATLPGRAGLVYLFPFAAVPMMVAMLLDHRLALVVAVFISLLVGPIAENSLEIATVSLVGGTIGSLGLRRVERISSFLWAGLNVAVASYAVVLAFHLAAGDYDRAFLASLAGTCLANGGISAALAAVASAPLGYFFGITTLIQLLELAHPSQPLFRRLLLEAPGTYHHSVLVANLAERGAEAIGEDTLLARVAAYYHDIGKVLHPYFFIENQTGTANIHDTMKPEASAQAIIAHVTDGVVLAKKHRLPKEIVEVIQQHHGTSLTTYFYNKALQTASDNPTVPQEPYRYPGPKPQSRLAALIMLADSTEALVRSDPDHSPEHIETLVRQVLNERLTDQLEESRLTFWDLASIRQAFLETLQGIYHPRIQYPERPEQRKKT